MPLVINDGTNPFFFTFTEPVANPGPNPKKLRCKHHVYLCRHGAGVR